MSEDCAICPPFVSRCTHAGDLLVCLVRKEDAIAEFSRRTGVLAIEGQPCPQCRLPVPSGGYTATVYGPGEWDPGGPSCLCRLQLIERWDVLELPYHAEGPAEEAALYAEAEARLRARSSEATAGVGGVLGSPLAAPAVPPSRGRSEAAPAAEAEPTLTPHVARRGGTAEAAREGAGETR